MNIQFFQPQFIQNPPLLNVYQEFNTPIIRSVPPPQALIYQAMMAKAKSLQMMQMRSMYLQNDMLNPINLELNFNLLQQHPLSFKQDVAYMKTESPSTGSEKSIRSTIPQVQPMQQSIPLNLDKPTQDQCLKMELEKIIDFLLVNMGQNRQSEIDNARKLYLHNSCLLQIFDKLVMKYFSAKKCREDIVRYILRKVFKVIRASIIKKEKVCNKKASVILCKKYFQKSFEKIQQSGVDASKDDELLEFFMPYKKKSKNRTMNTNFVLEIFSSEDFCEEYQLFLEEFNNFLTEDNNKKKEKLIEFLMDCIRKNCISKIGTYNRLPWLDIWIEDTKNIAWALIPNKKVISNCKKAKN